MSLFTANGVETSTLDQWFQRVADFKKSVWGSSYILDPSTKQGADALQLAELLYNAEMNNVSAFSQLRWETATGICLDYLATIRGLQRNSGYPQQIVVEITSSVVGYQITPSTIFSTNVGGFSYYVPATVDINDSPQLVVLVSSADGNPEVSAGDTLRTIQPFPNITNVVITDGGITDGGETETDDQLRARGYTQDSGFIGTLQLIFSELMQVQGISKGNYYYNDTALVVDGIDPYSTEFLAVPQDGVDDTTFNNLIAQRIVETKEPGAPTSGNTTVNLADYFGQPKTIKFTRPIIVPCSVNIQIGQRTDSQNIFSNANVPLQIQQCMDYINSQKIGTYIEWSRILGFFSNDTGYRIVDWQIKRNDGQWSKSDIPIQKREYAHIVIEDIVVGLGGLLP